MRSRSLRRPAIALLVLLTGAACGSAGTSTAPATSAPAAPATAYPMTVRTPSGAVTIPARPARIVSLSPTATEMLFAIGAGRQVTAVDSDSDYPADAPHTSLSGFQPNVEAIAGYRPDLVVIASDPGGLVKSLRSLRIPVLMEPPAQRLTDAYHQLNQLGAVTGHARHAAALSTRMRRQIAATIASVPRPAHPLTEYTELDDTYYSATSDTFLGQVFKAFGLRNIADRAKGAGSGYPQLSAEYIVAADPDLIFLADTLCCHQSRSTVAARSGWSEITAVKDDQVVGLNDDIASRWGPRIVTLYKTVARHVKAAEKAGR
jgi:iron complex transport system substrate-binding protein